MYLPSPPRQAAERWYYLDLKVSFEYLGNIPIYYLSHVKTIPVQSGRQIRKPGWNCLHYSAYRNVYLYLQTSKYKFRSGGIITRSILLTRIINEKFLATKAQRHKVRNNIYLEKTFKRLPPKSSGPLRRAKRGERWTFLIPIQAGLFGGSYETLLLIGTEVILPLYKLMF